ncbi:hypothetical protein GCM10022398_28390 [Acetobacter lovaniensis]|nr:hypothetical protein AA0474_2386 [Acetobacter lovaniensis NRIC 0474]
MLLPPMLDRGEIVRMGDTVQKIGQGLRTLRLNARPMHTITFAGFMLKNVAELLMQSA